MKVLKIIDHKKGLDGHYIKVNVNNVKYPKGAGEWYTISSSLSDQESEKRAKEYALWENAGKYISTSGIFFDSKEEYEKEFNEWLLNN